MPLNFLMIESLQKFHYYLGNDFKVECPTGSGNLLTLWEVSQELSQRLIQIFAKDGNGTRPAYRRTPLFRDEHWNDYMFFHEYFSGEDGAGLGAIHQSGWTSLVAKLIQQREEYRGLDVGRDDP